MDESFFRTLLSEIVGRTLVDEPRCRVLFGACVRVLEKEGDVAEVGVYKGGTARLIARTLPNKTIHLFDTFAGMPEVSSKDNHHKAKDFNDTSLESVSLYLKDLNNVKMYAGIFPETKTAETDSAKYALVHVDADIYKSILDCCDYFWPRMVSGGIIIFDDYGFPTCAGAKIAVREFCDRMGIKETELPTRQAVLLKP